MADEIRYAEEGAQVGSLSRNQLLRSDKKSGSWWRRAGKDERLYVIVLGVVTVLALIFLGGFAYMGNKYWTRERPAKLTTEVPKTELPPWLTIAPPTTQEPVITEPPPGWDRCLEADCALAAGQVLSAKSKDAEVGPCEDFYEYACGQWIHSNPAADVLGEWSPMKKVEMEVRREYMRSLLEDPRGPYENRTHMPAGLEMAVEYFEACQDFGKSRLISDYTSIHELLKKLLEDPTLVDLAGVLAGIQVQLGSNYFFEVDVELDAMDSGVYTVYMKRPKPGILPEYLSKPSTSVEHQRYVSKLGRIWAAVMGRTVEEGLEAAKDIIAVEELLWTPLYRTNETDGDRLDRYNLTSVEDLTALRIPNGETAMEELRIPGDGTLANPEFAYRTFFDKVFELDYGVIKPVVKRVVVDDYVYFQWLNTFFMLFDKQRLDNYLKGKILLDLASDISLELYDVVLDVEREKVGADHAETEWSSYCAESTAEHFGMVLGAVYAKEMYPAEYRYEIESMFTSMKTKLDENIQADKDISEDLKKHVSEKLAGLQVEIAHPEWIFNDMENKTTYNLNDFYEKLKLPFEGKDHLANVLAIKQWKEKQRLENFPLEADMFSWSLDPVDIRADYSPLTNTITLPAALFQSVWMVPNAKHITYGAIGSIVAREIVRAVDMIGLQYSANGNLLGSLDRTSYALLEGRAQCYVDQYNEYLDEASGTRVKGAMTRDENIVDSVGMDLAYQTYEYNFYMENVLPGVSHTAGELFFLSYAQMYCSRYKPEALKTLMREAKVPNHFRVQGAIANSPYFSQVWTCEKPSAPCALWSAPSA